MDTQPLWKAQEVAEYLSVPISTVRYWTSKGFIPFIKLPAAVRFQPEVIIDWARSMSKGGTPARSPKDMASDILSSHRTGLARCGKLSK
jgi:excisionase family DNA binding protein